MSAMCYLEFFCLLTVIFCLSLFSCVRIRAHLRKFKFLEGIKAAVRRRVVVCFVSVFISLLVVCLFLLLTFPIVVFVVYLSWILCNDVWFIIL